MPQEQHINTFEKGMTRDVNVIYQPDGTYRFAKNCQIVSQDGNNWTIKDTLGNTRIFQINIPYNTFVAPGTLTFQAYPTVIGFISFVDKLVVFSTNSELEAGGYGEIGVIYYDNYGEGIQPRTLSPANTYSGYQPLYHSVDLKFTKQRQIEGFAFDETESFQRVYWTDDLNEPRVFDVGNPIFTDYIASGSLVVGEEYMVLEGVIQHPVGVLNPYYGPGLGNVFTASSTTYTDFAVPAGTTAKVIKYYPYQLLAFQPSRSLGNIRFKELVAGGSVYCGSKMYFYRLADPANGLYTSWSYGCYPIPVGTDNNPSASPANSFFDYVGGGSTTTLVNSGRAVRIDIYGIDTNFPKIQVACAEFDQAVDVPRLISIVAEEDITGVNMVIEHSGNTNLGELTIDDITLFPASILKCKTMTTNKGYILIGNIEEREELEFDRTGVTFSNITNRFAVHEVNVASCPNVLTYTDLSPSATANPSLIIWGHQYIVQSDAGGPVVYNGNPYSVGEVFTGVLAVSAVVIPVGSELRPCIYNNKYTTSGGTNRPDIIGFYPGTSFWTYKNPAMVHHKLGYWANEKYRFGVMFYDLKGNPYYVRWLGDHSIPAYTSTLVMERGTAGDGGYDYWFLNQRGVRISGLTIPAADIDKISGFSIVRAERDKRIITEGLVLQCGAAGTSFKPLAGPNVADSDWFGSVNVPSYNYYIYICPDALVGYPMSNYAAGSNLEGGFFLQQPNYDGAGADLKNVDWDYQVETRWMSQQNDAVIRKESIVNMATVDEGVVINNFGTDNFAFWNQVGIAPGPGGMNVDIACFPAGPATFAGVGAIGGRKTVMELSSFLYDYTSGVTAYGDLAAVGDRKMVIDVTVNKTNQYGGTSETSLANTLYITVNHFQPITSAVKADTLDINGDYTFNNIDVWGGDCYTNLIDYGYALYDSAVNMVSYPNGSYSWGIKFPCQSNVNWDLRRGRTVANNKMYKGVADNGVWYRVGATSQLESFDYNEAYSSQGLSFKYPALPANYNFDNLFKYRVRFAGEKLPGEVVNSFRNFFPLDFKDLDGQGGEINNIRTKDGRVIVWQNAITSSVPVLERQLLAGGSGAPTTLGTGGVVDRYDPLTSYFGNQHQHGLTQTEFGFVWFDMRRKAFMVMDINSGIVEMSQILGMKGYFDEVIVDNLGVYSQSQPLNSPDFSETSDRPIMGVGVTGVYDPKFKMTYLTIKFRQHPESSAAVKINKDFTIGYYHPTKVFVGFYDFLPAISHNHNQIVLSCNNPKNRTKYYGTGMSSTAFVVGEVASYENEEWICIQNVTITGYRADATKEPGSLGVAYWTRINKTNDVWVLNQPTTLSQGTAPDYQYNKFFGQVVDNEIEFIVNPKTQNPFAVMNMEQVGNNVFPTSVYIDAGSQSASDTDIRTTSNYYRYIWDRICSSMPLSSTGRVVNNYLKVKLVKKNWTGSQPTVLTGAVKILQVVKSFFVQKR